MEKAKRIIKIVLFIIVIPIVIAQASQNVNISAYEEAVRNISEDYNDGYSSIVDVALRPATQIAGSTFLLSPIMLIVAGVLTSKNKKKPFDLLVAGILLLSIFINNLRIPHMINKLSFSSKYPAFSYAEIHGVYFKSSAGRFANTLLFVPMVALFAIAIVQLINYIKEQKVVYNKISSYASVEGTNALIDVEAKNKLNIILSSIGGACIIVPYIVACFISSSLNSNAIVWMARYAFHGYIYPIIIGIVLIILYAPKIGTKIRITEDAILGRSSLGEYIYIKAEDVVSIKNKNLSLELTLVEEVINIYTPDNKAVAEIISEMLNKRHADRGDDTDDGEKSTKETVLIADELKKFKELLDAGVITQEEFDAKKKQLLGL